MTNEEAISVIENEIQIDVRLCTDEQVDRFQTALYMAISALRAKPTGDPLTLEQLREMDGEPVWVQTPGIPQYGRWVIVAGIDTNDGQKTLYCQGDYTCRNYGQDWLAYRRPPEGEA